MTSIQQHLLATVLSMASAHAAWAGVHAYQLVPADSALTLSGTVSSALGTFPLTAQGAGSLTTTYSGQVWLRLFPVSAAPAGLSLQPATLAVAANSGNWRPNSASPPANVAEAANYGARVVPVILNQLDIALRGLQATAGGPATPAALTGGSFDEAGITFTVVAGTADYLGTGFLLTGIAGNSPLDGTGPLFSTPEVSSLTRSFAVETLVLRVSTELTGVIDASTSITYQINGTLQARRLIGDQDNNFVVNLDDLADLLNNLGLLDPAMPGEDAAADLDGNGRIDAADLAGVLARLGNSL